jgi:hypothetical protein
MIRNGKQYSVIPRTFLFIACYSLCIQYADAQVRGPAIRSSAPELDVSVTMDGWFPKVFDPGAGISVHSEHQLR